MAAKLWARVRHTGAHNLRRGAWYPVVNDSNPSMVILDVSKHNVPVPRDSVDLAEKKPERWSVVRWDPSKPLPRRIGQENLPLTYAVCPFCRARGDVLEGQKDLVCLECKMKAEVDWVDTC
jgi:hypothetical protein